MQLSAGIKDLYQRLQAIDRLDAYSDDVSKIEVDEIASRLARLYEQIRNTIDYKEDYVLRRFAMERLVRRQLITGHLDPKIARRMLEELIRGHYLPNQTLPETIVNDIEVILEKYSYLLVLLAERDYPAKEKSRYQDWLVSILACEIDLFLSPENKNDALIEAAYQFVKDRVKVRGQGLSLREKNIQVYIAIHRDLVMSDNAIIGFHLFQLYFPDWTSKSDRRLVQYVADKFPAIFVGIQQHLAYRDQPKIKIALRKEMAIFKVLKHIIFVENLDLTELLANPDKFKQQVGKSLNALNKRIKSKITRSSFRAIFYIFLTKMLLALLLEYPYDLLVAKHVNYTTLGINILFPPILMFLMALSAQMPGATSQAAITDGAMSYVYGEPENKTLILLRNPRKRGPIASLILYLVYLILYGFVFGLIIFYLHKFGFNLLSGGLFIFFVTAVSFFAVRIRQQAKEFNVIQKREGVISFLLNFFSLPIIKLGSLLSSNISRINVFIFLFDFVLEAPFKLFIALLENIFGYVKEKREEVYKE
jgi:hypothetical protein